MKKTLLVLTLALPGIATGVVLAPPAALAQTPPKPKKLTKDDVVKMVHAGIPENVIISKIKNSGSVFHLEVADMIALKKVGVSDRVLEAMVNTEMGAGRPEATPTPAPQPTGGGSGGNSEEESILGGGPPTDNGTSGGEEGGGSVFGSGQNVSLSQAAGLFRDQKWPEASDALFNLIENNKLNNPSDLADAQQHLGDSLYHMGLYQSALYYYLDAIHNGAQTRAFGPSLARVIELSDKLRDDRRLLQELQNIQPAQIPAELRRDAGYFYGQLFFRKEDYDGAKRALHAVGKDSPYYGKARYTEGVIDSLGDDIPGAVAAFRDSINAGGAPAPMSKVSSGDNAPDVVEDEARLAVARTLYAAGKYDQAVKAFRDVSQDGNEWAPSLFDNAWALYKNGEFGSSLGNVLSTRSPFFDAYYEPEGMILEAIVYYRLCLFPQANMTINKFVSTYGPYFRKIDSFNKQAASRPPEQVFAFLKDFVDSPKGKAASFMPYDLMLTVAQDGKISDILYHLRAIEYEQARIRDIGPWRGTRVAQACMDQMNGHKESLQKLGGKLVQLEFENQYDKLNDLLAQAKTIRFEITLGEKNALEQSIIHGTGAATGAVQGHTHDVDVHVPDDHYYWPFEGEYWKDEIGYYQFAVEGECAK